MESVAVVGLGSASSAIGRYRIRAEPQSDLHIPPFAGSMFRGAIGHALRHLYCQCQTPSSGHEADCVYASLFETAAGNAFVITPPPEKHCRPGQTFDLHITLLKNNEGDRDAFFEAVLLGFRRGLGPGMVPCEVTGIEQLTPEIVPLSQRVRLELATPWFIKFRGKPITARELTVHSFLIALAQRQRSLVREGLLDVTVPANDPLLALADTLTGTLEVHDVSGMRRSRRQQTKHPLRGISGSVELEAPQPDGLRELTGMICRAQWLHGGGKVSFGLGALTIKPGAKPQSQLGELKRMVTGESV